MSLKTVYLLAFLDAFNFGLLLPVVNPHIIALGGSFMLCGILQSVGAGMQLFASPIVGGWSDTYGRRFVLICSFAVCLISDAIIGINSLPLFLIGRTLYGVARHTDPLIKAVVTDMFPDKEIQTQAFNNLMALPGLAYIIGPIFGGILHQQFTSLGIISAVLCTIDVLIIAVIFMWIPDIKIEKKHEQQKDRDWKKFIDLLSVKFAVEVAYNFLFMNTGLIFTKKYLFTQTQIGLSIAYMSGTLMVGALLTPHIKRSFYANDATGSKRIMHALVLMVSSFIVLLFTHNGPLHLGIILPASVAKLIFEIAWMEALTARTSESEKGFMMGVATSMLSAAGLICPLISGTLADYIGLNVLTSLPVLPAITGILLATKLQKLHTN